MEKLIEEKKKKFDKEFMLYDAIGGGVVTKIRKFVFDDYTPALIEEIEFQLAEQIRYDEINAESNKDNGLGKHFSSMAQGGKRFLTKLSSLFPTREKLT